MIPTPPLARASVLSVPFHTGVYQMSTDVDPLSELGSDVKSAVSSVGRKAGAAARRSAEFFREAGPTVKEALGKAGGMLGWVVLTAVGLVTWPFRQWKLAVLYAVAIPIAGSLYVSVGAAGTRLIHSLFGTKLYKAIPFLAKYRYSHDYDLAVVAALILGAASAVMVTLAWRIVLKGTLGLETEFNEARAAKAALLLGLHSDDRRFRHIPAGSCRIVPVGRRSRSQRDRACARLERFTGDLRPVACCFRAIVVTSTSSNERVVP